MKSILEIRTYYNTVSGAISYKYFFNGEKQTEEEARKIFGHNIAAKHLSWPLPENIIIRLNKSHKVSKSSQITPFKPSETELTNRQASISVAQHNTNDTTIPQPTLSPCQPACEECKGPSASSN